jgi:hypothetical protein
MDLVRMVMKYLAFPKKCAKFYWVTFAPWGGGGALNTGLQIHPR